jgi:hypothetical protein
VATFNSDGTLAHEEVGDLINFSGEPSTGDYLIDMNQNVFDCARDADGRGHPAAMIVTANGDGSGRAVASSPVIATATIHPNEIPPPWQVEVRLWNTSGEGVSAPFSLMLTC